MKIHHICSGVCTLLIVATLAACKSAGNEGGQSSGKMESVVSQVESSEMPSKLPGNDKTPSAVTAKEDGSYAQYNAEGEAVADIRMPEEYQHSEEFSDDAWQIFEKNNLAEQTNEIVVFSIINTDADGVEEQMRLEVEDSCQLNKATVEDIGEVKTITAAEWELLYFNYSYTFPEKISGGVTGWRVWTQLPNGSTLVCIVESQGQNPKLAEAEDLIPEIFSGVELKK